MSFTSKMKKCILSPLRKSKESILKKNLLYKHKMGLYEKILKRPQDIICASVGLVVLSPIFGILAFLVKKNLGSPIIFTQERPGLNGEIFKLYKFRTMTDEKDEHGNLLPDKERLTSFGKWLRRTSLDELPELFNLLRGDISLVGPRPLLVQYLPLYNKKQARRHEVRPGLTGLAQVSGRNFLSWEEKFEKDVYYVDHVSFVMDLQIIIQTFKVLLTQEGINSTDGNTMDFFSGTIVEEN